MNKERVTLEQLDLMRHTVGIDRSNKPYRNYFSADENHQDIDNLNELVEMGLMIKTQSIASLDMIFALTDEGCYFLNINGVDSIE